MTKYYSCELIEMARQQFCKNNPDKQLTNGALVGDIFKKTEISISGAYICQQSKVQASMTKEKAAALCGYLGISTEQAITSLGKYKTKEREPVFFDNLLACQFISKNPNVKPEGQGYYLIKEEVIEKKAPVEKKAPIKKWVSAESELNRKYYEKGKDKYLARKKARRLEKKARMQ